MTEEERKKPKNEPQYGFGNALPMSCPGMGDNSQSRITLRGFDMQAEVLGKTLAVLLLLISSVPAAFSSYYLPPAKQSLKILSPNWQIKNVDSAPRLIIDRAERAFDWNVEMMWLADRINSDSICTGEYNQLMKEYLQKLQASQRNKPLLIELSSVDGKNFFVSGLWLFDAPTSFQKGLQFGSPLLKLTKEQVESLKTSEAYAKRVENISEQNWLTLTKPTEKASGKK